MPSLDIDDSRESFNPHVAGLLAVRLVSQVLDEAYVIAIAADESGQPWRYLSMLKSLRSGRLGDTDEEISFVALKGDSDGVDEHDEEHISSLVATSTPQKIVRSDGTSKSKTETNIIGQGDEEFDMQKEALSESTSMFINHLFDMSEVERVVICDDTEIVQSNPEPSDVLTRAMTNIMESYVNTAFNIALKQENLTNKPEAAEIALRNTEKSCYSFLAHAFGTDVANDLTYFVHDGVASDNYTDLHVASDNDNDIQVLDLVDEKPSAIEQNEDNDETRNRIGKNDVAFYENAYLTLNRDYDQCSDGEGAPVLQDPKGMALQEVDLLTANTSESELSTHRERLQEERKELAAISGVSGVSGKSKSSLMSRCRTRGARLLSCLRGWWRRKTPGKRREARPRHGSIRGICPLSPDARRRATSLLDNRGLCSPTAKRSTVWKFNTVNETLVTSSRWKDYKFEVKPEECGENRASQDLISFT